MRTLDQQGQLLLGTGLSVWVLVRLGRGYRQGIPPDGCQRQAVAYTLGNTLMATQRERDARRKYDRTRGTAAERGYDADW